jgi:hypothetical protein
MSVDTLNALSGDEVEALRELCVKFWHHAPRDNYNVAVTEARRSIFEALALAGLIDYHGDVAALKTDRLDICKYLIGPSATR